MFQRLIVSAFVAVLVLSATTALVVASPNQEDGVTVREVSSTPITGGPWKAQYFNNRNLAGQPAVVKEDSEISFDWGKGIPCDGVRKNNFSVRWTSTENFDSGRYRFHITADDGVRLKIDGKLIIDQWHDTDGPVDYYRAVNLTEGPHVIRVTYYSGLGDSSIQFWWEPAPLPGIPASPTLISAAGKDPQSIKLVWQDNSNNEQGFVIFTGHGYDEVARVKPGATSYVITGLEPGSWHGYSVAAYNIWGMSSPSLVGFAGTPTSVDSPSSPRNLVAKAINSSTIKLTWEDRSLHEDGFYIYDFEGQLVADLPPDTTKFLVTGLAPGTYKGYRICSYNEKGNSAWIGWAEATTPISAAPTAPTNLGSSIKQGGRIFLYWTDNSIGEQGFRVYEGTTLIGSTGPDSTVFTVTGLEPWSEHCYTVVAFNETGESSPSNEACDQAGGY